MLPSPGNQFSGFAIVPALALSCASLPAQGDAVIGSVTTVPIYRAYNNGLRQGRDSNHRIAGSRAAIQQVVVRGWIDEGLLMCAPA